MSDVSGVSGSTSANFSADLTRSAVEPSDSVIPTASSLQVNRVVLTEDIKDDKPTSDLKEKSEQDLEQPVAQEKERSPLKVIKGDFFRTC